MRLRFIWIGKTRERHVKALLDEYKDRLDRFVQCQVIELGEPKVHDVQKSVEEQGGRIIRALRSDEIMVLLDAGGLEWTSEQVAGQLEGWQSAGDRHVAFVAGGPFGVSAAVRARANVRWSLSRLTLTHELVRVVALEQVYRAFTIVNRIPYHK